MRIIGVDNGITGAVTIIEGINVLAHFNIPTKKELSYTKAKQWINRIDTELTYKKLSPYKKDCFCLLERPMVNPMRFKASASALRSLEAVLIVLENLSIPFRYIDSKEWQKALLPTGLKRGELKKAAVDVTKRLFPKLEIVNADSVLIAYYGAQMHNR